MTLFRNTLLVFLTGMPFWVQGINLTWNFESGENEWTSWGVNAKANISPEQRKKMVVISELSPYEGRKCIMMKDEVESANPFLALRKPISVDPGKRYFFKGYIRSGDRIPVPASVRIAAESNGKFLKWFVAKVDVGKDWREFSIVTGTLPKETTQLRPSVFIFSNNPPPSGKGSVYLDQLSFGETSLVRLDLSQAVNRAFIDQKSGDGVGGWTDQGNNDLRNMKGGEKIVGNIPFDIVKPVKATANTVIGLRKGGGFADRAELVLPQTKCDWIYILSTAAWAKGKAGSITINYADNSADTINVNCGEQVGDWWTGLAQNAASVPLNNACPQKSPVYLFAGAVKNKYPKKAVKSLQFSAGDRGVVWLILGVTLGCGENMLEASVTAQRDYSKWFSFKLKNKKSPGALVNLAFLLDPPAGKHGFLRSTEGKFVFEDGTPGRFFGTNIHSNTGLFPTQAQAEGIADTLARYGMNLVRLHLTEFVMIDTTFADRQHFIDDQQKLDRLDYFIKCLEDRGIYLLLDSVTGLSARRFTAADGIVGYKEYFPHRPWAYFDPVLIEIGKKYMKDYLTHVNKYTGKSLINDPGVAMLMVINEESIFFDRSKKNGGPDYYPKLLAKLFSHWLTQTYGSREALAKVWNNKDRVSVLQKNEDPAKENVAPISCGNFLTGTVKDNSSPRTKDSLGFYRYLQTAYYSDMKKYLKTLGCKVPVAGSNMIWYVAELKSHLVMDYTSQNMYFDHVSTGANGAWTMTNIPMTKVNPVTGNIRLIEPTIAAVKLHQLPVTSTETDAMWPHEWRASHMISLATTSSLQDWDAVLQYSYMGGYGYTWNKAEKFEQIEKPTVEFNDPAIFGTFPAAAIIYHRRDVTPSKNLVQLVYDEKDCLNTSNRLNESLFPFNYLTYVSKVESCFGPASHDAAMLISTTKQPDGKPFMQYSSADAKIQQRMLAVKLDKSLKKNGIVLKDRGLQDSSLVSDTGEIVRDWEKGLLLVNTPRSQGITGFPGVDEIRLKDVSIQSSNIFATIIVSSLDGRNLAASTKVFLTTVGRAENSKDKISYGRTVKDYSGVIRGEGMSLEHGKDGKVLTEIVNAKIKIKALAVKLTALAPDMSAAAPAQEFKAVNGMVTVVAGQSTPSIWYLLEIVR